jgi:opacity protein-like surface antigen
MKRLLILASLAIPCFAESPIIIGVRGGVPLNDAIQAVQSGSGASSSTDNYVVGPTLGIRLPLGFSVTGDALFTRLNFSEQSGSFKASSNSLEFPVLLRFTPGSGPLRPFIGAGASVRHLSNFSNAGSFFTGGSSSDHGLEKSLGIGFVIGGGVDLRLGPLHVSPEIRYTHWNSNDVSSAFSNVVKFNDNEGQILVGLTF